MEGVVNKIGKAVERAANNNTVINVCLVAAFVALGARSVSQQRDIQALESQMDSLISSNKSLKKAMWDWKQQLFADADSDSALVPLARLKAIYGDAPVSQTGTLSFSL